MNYKERIEKLVQSGRLSAAHGDAMKASLSGNVTAAVAVDKKKLPTGIIAGGLLVAAACIIAVTGNDPAAVEIIQNVNETLNKSGEVGAMNKGLTGIICAVVFVVPVLLWFMYLYNDLVSDEENVMGAWAQVESNYQRRADLIPNLVSTVKAFAEQERQIMTQVAENRPDNLQDILNAAKDLEAAKETAATADKEVAGKPLDETSMQKLAVAQKTVGDNITRLFGLAENYPNLRSSDNFLALQDQIEGTENRINVARMVFNDAVRDFNASMRKMPTSLVAGAGNFQRKAYFEADKASEAAVKVDFQ